MKKHVPMSAKVSAMLSALILAIVLSAPLAPVAMAEEGDAAAEAFITKVAGEGLAILDDTSLSIDVRTDKFADLVIANADIEKIGYFTLGNHRRKATPEELEEFNGLFKDFTRNFYSTRLGEYSGQTLDVTGSVLVKKDVIVTSLLNDPDGAAPTKVNWRLRKGDDGYKLRDLEVLGVWLALEQRSQFNAIISNNGGKVSALLDELRDKVESGESFETDADGA